MKYLLASAFTLALTCACAAQTVAPAPPSDFDPINAIESDLLTYSVPPTPLVPGSARAAWTNAMKSFNTRDVTNIFTPGGHLFATGSTFHVSPSGTGTCPNNTTSCTNLTPPAATGTACSPPASGVINSSGQCVAPGSACTHPVGTGCTTNGGCPGTVNVYGNCIVTAAPVGAPGSACTTGGNPGVINSSGACVQNGTPCTGYNGVTGQYENGVCAVAGGNCTTADGASGVWTSTGSCVTPGTGCTTSTGFAGQYNSAGTCGATQPPSGSGGGSSPTGSFATPTFGAPNPTQIFAGVDVRPTTPSIFTTAAIQFQLTIPTLTNRPGTIGTGEVAIWDAIQPIGGSSILQAGVIGKFTSTGWVWNPVYAWSGAGSIQNMTSPAIHPGDTVFVELWNTDSTHASIYISNTTTGISSLTNILAAAGVTFSPQEFIWALENPSNLNNDSTPNFSPFQITSTAAWNTTSPVSGTPAIPTSGQTVFEANAYSLAPTYQTFSGAFSLLEMLGTDKISCCAVTPSVSGTGTITFTRSPIIN